MQYVDEACGGPSPPPPNIVEPLYSGHPWGEKLWPLYRGGLFRTQTVHVGIWVPGRYTEGWPLFRGGR